MTNLERNPVLQILFLANQSVLIWLPAGAEVESAAALARMVRDGRWQLPDDLAAGFAETGPVPLRARVCGDVVVVWPARPLGELNAAPAPQWADLTADQVAVLRLLAGGRTTAQVAAALFHSERWVRYQVQQVKAMCGAQTRAQVVARFRQP